MNIVNTQLPITSESCGETLRLLVEAYPIFRSQVLGYTAYGRPIRTLVAGTGPRKVLFSAAHHANEWITSLVLLQFAEDLARAPGNLLEKATVYMVPMVDPDGVDLVTGAIKPGEAQYESAKALAENYPQIPFPEGWKANLLGVDLNLQYPAKWLTAREIKFSQGFTEPGPRDYVGRAPLNQQESRAMAEYTEFVDPDMVIALHTQGAVIYWQFLDIQVPGARAYAQAFAQASGYALEDTPYESSFAGYKDWFIQSFGRPGYTVEAGRGESPLPLTQFDEIYRACQPILLIAAEGEIDYEPISGSEPGSSRGPS